MLQCLWASITTSHQSLLVHSFAAGRAAKHTIHQLHPFFVVVVNHVFLDRLLRMGMRLAEVDLHRPATMFQTNCSVLLWSICGLLQFYSGQPARGDSRPPNDRQRPIRRSYQRRKSGIPVRRISSFLGGSKRKLLTGK